MKGFKPAVRIPAMQRSNHTQPSVSSDHVPVDINRRAGFIDNAGSVQAPKDISMQRL